MNDFILSAVFVKEDPDVEAKVEAFFDQLDELQKELGFSHYITVEDDRGEEVEVKIYPASITAFGGTAAIEADREASKLEQSSERTVRKKLGITERLDKKPKTEPCPHSSLRVAQMFAPRPLPGRPVIKDRNPR